MLAMLLASGLLVAVCCLIGQAIVHLCGFREWQWWAPAVGLAALMVVFGQVVRVQDDQWLLLVATGLLTVASLVPAAVRRALRSVAAEAGLLALAVLLIAAIPFFAFGYAGVLGATVSNDMSQHLSTVYWLQHRIGVIPVAAIGGTLVDTGYPLGPHGLAAALDNAFGIGQVRAFSAETLAAPPVTALVAYGLAPTAPRPARAALGASVGLGYLLAAYLAQGQFKEIQLALLVLAVAAILTALQGGGWRRAIPIGVITAGTIYTYSYGGVLWIGTLVLFFLATEVFRRRQLFAVVREWLPTAIATAIATAVLVLPELERVQAFRSSIFGQEPLRNRGNLQHALNPLESLGVWFNGDYRFNPDPRWPTTLFCMIALTALAGSLLWWWRRRALALPAAVAAATLVWVSLALTVNIYNAAKGLVVLAPLVMACIGVPLAVAWSRGGPRIARAVGVVLFAGAAISSFGVLRSAPVGLGSHEDEFAQIRSLVRDRATLFVDNDHFGQWELRGARPLYTTHTLYSPARLPPRSAKRGKSPVDVDVFDSSTLDKVAYIVMPGGAYRSQVPPNFVLALRTDSYDVFRRNGPTPARDALDPLHGPGAVFDCNSRAGRRFAATYAWAGILPRPIRSGDWQGSIARPGGRATVTVTLPRGRWDISLRYVSTTAMTVSGPGLRERLAPNFGLVSSYWPAGTITSDGRPLTLTATTAQRTWFARLLGPPRPLRAAGTDDLMPLRAAVFTRRGATAERVPVRAACGRYVDWFAPAGSDMRGRSDPPR